MTLNEKKTKPLSFFFKKLSPLAITPLRATEGSAGYDLYSPRSYIIECGQKALIPLDISIEIPPTHYGRLAPRSSLANKFAIDVLAGVIDSDFRGNIGLILINHDKENPFIIREGERIGQIIFEKISTPKLVEKKELEETVRGSGGYGSTGK
jgi:dUTP pyrophosphatase